MSKGDAAGESSPERDREQLLAETFVVLADTLVDDYDVVDLLHQLVDACVNLLAVSAAGLLLDDQRGNLAVVASSNEETRLLEVLQLQSDAGPCLDCVRTGVPVGVDDLDARSAPLASVCRGCLVGRIPVGGGGAAATSHRDHWCIEHVPGRPASDASQRPASRAGAGRCGNHRDSATTLNPSQRSDGRTAPTRA